MRRIWPVIPMIAAGCATEYTPGTEVERAGAMNPRPLETVRHTDRILQVNQPEVDVLWVVDSSGSMGDDQDAVKKHFPIFFEFFEGSGTDYHLGVISTDMYMASRQGRLITVNGRRYIDPDTPNAAQVFNSMMPALGVDTEQGTDATYAALETQRMDYNLGFLREKSSVHVIVISDEWDSSEMAAEELASYLNGLRQDPDMVTFSSISRPDSYVNVTNMVGGIHHPILETDWGLVLEQLGLQAAGLKREYFLSRLPVPDTIVVTVQEGENVFSFSEGADWVYNPVRNSISFHKYVPNPFAEVIIDYALLSAHDAD